MSSDFFFLTNECVEQAPFINVLRSLAQKEKEDTQAHKVKQMKKGRQVTRFIFDNGPIKLEHDTSKKNEKS